MRRFLVAVVFALALAAPVAAAPPQDDPGAWELTATWADGFAVVDDPDWTAALVRLNRAALGHGLYTMRVTFIADAGYNERLGS